MGSPNQVHVTVPPGARPSPHKGVRVHWSRLQPHESADGTTTTLRTVLDCAVALPLPRALAIADSALRLGRITAEELHAGAAAQAPRRRGRCAHLARHADGRAHTAFESALRAIVLEVGLTGFVPQLPVQLGRFTVHVDLGDPERRIAIEGDSYARSGSQR